jgi:suppressor for copper-sensitivity B
MRHSAYGVIAALALIWMAPTAQGQSFAGATQKPDIKVDLLTGDSQAGEAWVGVRVDLGPGWKTYWKSPGDAGLPPEFDWSGSSNVDHAEVNWPAPSRLSIQGIETVGYTHQVLFPVRIRVRDPAIETKVQLKLEVYACSTICVREERVLSTTIQPGVNGSSQAAIDSWRSKVPRATSEVLSVISVERSTTGPASLRLTIASSAPLLEPDAFIDSDPPLSGDKPVVTFDLDNRATLAMNLPGVTAESIRARPLNATIVSGEAAVLAVSPAPQASEAAKPAGLLDPRATIASHGGLVALIGIALAGGFILNLMPCVFPVLSLKLLSFVHGSTASRSQIRRGFAASAAGILVSFLLLAGVLAGMKAAGASVGWGIQFQQPLFLAGMAVVLVLFAANQFDLIHIPVSSGFLTRLSGIAGGTSATAHFLSGFAATLLATPCSAPLVGTAVGFALSQGTVEIIVIFAALGVGMASPYLLVAAFPAMADVVPRPGPWLMRVKWLFGSALLLSAGWLLVVLAEVTDKRLAIALGATLIAFLALWKHATPKMVAVAMVAVAATVAVFALAAPWPRARAQDEISWRTFSNRDLKALVGAGRTVFVDVTADWCITCKINKAFVLNKPEVTDRLSSDVVPMRADWTKPDTEILQFLSQHGRFGIPFNIVFGPAAPNGIALSEILSTSSVSAAFNDAAATSNSSQPR